MSTSTPATQAFMEMAAGVLLAGAVGGEQRPDLVRMAAQSGLTESEMDELLHELAEQRVVRLEPSFAAASVAEISSEPVTEQPASGRPTPPSPPAMVRVSPARRLELEDSPAPATFAADTPDCSDTSDLPDTSNPLLRDMFKQRVVAALKSSGQTLDAVQFEELVKEAVGLGLAEPAARQLLERWCSSRRVDATLPVPPPLPAASPLPDSEAALASAPPLPPLPTVAAPPIAPPIAPPTDTQPDDGVVFLESPSADGIEYVEVAPEKWELLRQRAVALIAAERGWSSRCRQLLSAEARALQLPDDAVQRVVAELHSDLGPASATAGDSQPIQLPQDDRTQTGAAHGGDGGEASNAGPTSPLAPPAAIPDDQAAAAKSSKRTPADSYRRYLRKAIPQLGREQISVRSEQRLVREGVEKLRLGAPYATELLREVAAELSVPLLSLQSIEADHRFDTFRDRAAVILAEHRGVNTKSRMFLVALGDELGLCEEELDQAILQLSGAARSSLEEDKRQAFQLRVRTLLAAMSEGVITAPIESAIAEDGVLHDGLSANVAIGLLRCEAKEAGIAVIDKRQATAHIARRLADREAGQELSTLMEESRLWGLSDEEFEAALELHRSQLAKQQRRERRIAAAALISSGIVASGLIFGAAWLWWPGANTSEAQPTEIDSPVVARPAAHQEPLQPKLDPELQIAISQARRHLPLDFQAVLDSLGAVEPDRRQHAAVALVEPLVGALADRAKRDALTDLIKHWYRVEPEFKSAQTLMFELLALLPRRTDELPERLERYEDDFRMLQSLLTVVSQDGLAEERAKWLAEQLSDRIDHALDIKLGEEELARQGKCQLAIVLYRNLISASKTKEGPFEPHHWALSFHLVSFVNPVHAQLADDLQLEFLESVLRTGKESWQPYDELIRRFAYSNHAPTALRMSELMLGTSDESLRETLARLLLLNIGSVASGQSAEEVAELVKRHFNGGGKPADARSSFAETFVDDAERQLKLAPPHTNDGLAEQIVAMARLNALGCAARMQREDRYDALRKAPKPTLPRASSRPMRTVTSEQEETLHNQIQILVRTRAVPRRIQQFQNLANLASRPPFNHLDTLPNPTRSAMFAEFLVAPKSTEEHGAMLVYCRHFQGWPMLLLALADELEKFKGREGQIEELVFVFTGHVDVKPGESWQEKLQAALVREAANQLAGAGAQAGVTKHAGQHLESLYRFQGELRGVPVAALDAADGADHVVAELIRLVVGQLGRETIDDPDDQQWLSQIPQRVEATVAAGENEMQRLALLQRTWLRVLRIELALSSPERMAEGRQLEEELRELDRQAKSVWEQIHHGERQLLRMRILQNDRRAS
ncbi:MAG: hypothetical protein KDB14_34715 [Planctomycetales bacterium]|nr:hypothetical protein [Planctomycetales bacterium]